MNDFPELPLEPKEPAIICYCDHCGEEVYESEQAFLGQEGYIHRDCMPEFIQNRFGIEYQAEKLGYMLIYGGVYV